MFRFELEPLVLNLVGVIFSFFQIDAWGCAIALICHLFGVVASGMLLLGTYQKRANYLLTTLLIWIGFFLANLVQFGVAILRAPGHAQLSMAIISAIILLIGIRKFCKKK